MNGRFLFLLALVIFFTVAPAMAQNPPEPKFECDGEMPAVLDYVPHVGTVKVMWIVCAPDSGALAPLDSLSIGRTDWCHNGQRVRVMYPSTYSMPSWADELLDTTMTRSMGKYYKDQSNNLFRIYGHVLGQNDSTIFLSDPDTSVRPTQPFVQCGNSGGNAFFQNIMLKVDAAVNLADYDVNGNGVVDEAFFHIYGLAEDGDFQGTGGVSGLAGSYTSPTDTTASGVHISVSDGLTIWSPSPEAYVQYGWTQGNAEEETYWQAHNIAAHEFGHDLGLFHTAFLGNYDPMERGPFVDPATGVLGPTSPYNLQTRVNFGWAYAFEVTRPIYSLYLGDLLTYSTCLKIPSYTNGTPSSDQNFLAMASTREKLWESNYPYDGVMIYHVNPQASGGNSNKQLDPELSSGLFDWNEYYELVNPDWHVWCFPCSVYAYENTLDSNTVAGLDSFDFEYRHVPGTYPDGMFPYGHWGTRGNYFATGDTFNFASNPTSHVHSPANSANQSRATMAHLNVTAVDPFAGNCTLNAWSRHWRGNVTTDVTWLDSIVVDSSVAIASGATLTIEPGTKILADSGATITINGFLDANGTEGDSIRFSAAPGESEWGGIYVGQGAYADVSYAVIEDAPVAFWSENAGVSDIALQLTDTRIQGGSLRLWGSSTRTHLVERVTIHDIPAESSQSGFYFLNTKVVAVDFTVLNSEYRTGYCNNTTGSILHGYFSGRATHSGLIFYGSTSGLTLKCCTMDHIAPEDTASASVRCLNQTNPVFGEAGDPPLNNYIVDDQAYLIRITGGGDKPKLDGFNNILIQERLATGGKFFKWDTPGGTLPYSVKYIYWGGVTPVIGYFDPANTSYWNWNAYLREDPGSCGSGVGYAFESAFDSALALEQQQQYPAAQAAYLQIAATDSYAVGDRTVAAQRAVMVDRETQALSTEDVAELSEALTGSAESLTDSLGIERLRLCHATDESDFAGALEGYEALLERDLSVEDSLLTVIDMLQVQLLADGGGRLDAALAPRNPAYAIQSKAHGVQMVNAAMDALMGQAAKEDAVAPIPSRYALYQNYPNPFNPVTEIRFDLPENARVELTIFNTLGQKVATLINETRAAGSYRVEWDASHAASGMYLYQLKAGSFVETKKMMLLR